VSYIEKNQKLEKKLKKEFFGIGADVKIEGV
jgi:hypothetical protein